MRRILLLDDSANIQKVVKLTFSSDANCEVKIARTEAEAQLALAEARPDAVIAYAQFSKGDPVQYFSSIRDVCPNILLLTESDFDAGSLVNAGFTHILRKPFASVKLKGDVLAFWGETPPPITIADVPPPPPPPITIAAVPPPPPPPITIADVPPPPPPPITIADVPPPPPPPITVAAMPPPPPPPPPPALEVPPDLFKTASFAPVDVPSVIGAHEQPQPTSAFLASPSTPEISMDLEALERTFRSTLSTNATSDAQPDINPTPSVHPTQSHEIPIEIVANQEKLEIENMAVRTKSKDAIQPAPPQHQATLPENWRQEMNEAIDDAVFRIVERALPARIDAKMAEILPNVEESVERLREEISEKLMAALRAQVVTSVQKWLQENLVGIAREEVRGEIQKIVSAI